MFRLKSKKYQHFLCILLSFSLTAVLCLAAEQPGTYAAAALTGKALAEKVYQRENGESAAGKMEMILADASGFERHREFQFFRKDYGDLSKNLIRFTEPADIRGTAFLSIEQPGGETEQFLYLPSLRRTRRIIASQKGRRFVNSDFTYEDMERRPVEKFGHRINGESRIDGKDCYILESLPKKDASSQYFLIQSFIQKADFMPLQVDFFDKSGKRVKTYRVLETETIQGIPTETRVRMEDMERKHRTDLKVLAFSYNVELDDALFTKRKMENW
ncbi:MAG: outer membrane lipoprotein-sorting protein [Deltaproteobacteria bacterium]|nr:outer membrane lipoprotein-sorting protein [Deltaproteobacteria bacterium]